MKSDRVDNQVDLTITMASFNSRDVIQECLRSIFRHTQDVSFEVIVVDNASSDGSAQMIEQEFPLVHLIRSPRNLGFGAAHNVAMQHAQGKYILILNSDVLFLDNAASRMIETFQSWSSKVGGLGPRILNRDGTYAPSASHRQFPPLPLLTVSITNLFFPFVHHIPLNWIRDKFGYVLSRLHGKFLKPSSVERVEWVDGICVLFSRGILERVGLFDEQYFFDMEIGDLLYRIREDGWEIVFDAETAIIHLGGYSRRLNPSILRQSIKSTLVYYAKFRPGYVLYLKALLFVLLTAKILHLKMSRAGSGDSQLYLQIMEDVKSFRTSGVRVNQIIPHLPQQNPS